MRRIFKGFSQRDTELNVGVSAKYPTFGIGSDRENARSIRGMKKFVHTRIRAGQREALHRIVENPEEQEPD